MNTVKRTQELADSHGLTMFQLAELSGVPYSTLKSAIARNTQLNVDTIERICIGLKMPLYCFFQEQNEEGDGYLDLSVITQSVYQGVGSFRI